MVDSMISVNNVTKTFKMNKKSSHNHRFKSDQVDRNQNFFVVLKDISFEVKAGKVLGIIGLNGSGKTTLLRLISGIYKPDLGTINVHGKLSPLLQIGTGFHNDLMAKENILTYGMLLGMTKFEIENKIDKILRFAELEDFENVKLKDYSAGMRARLGFSTALQVNPDILIVDEILAVGDESFRKKSFKAFSTFKEENKTILFTTHNMAMISELSDEVLLLDKGKIVSIGEPNSVIQHYKKIISEN